MFLCVKCDHLKVLLVMLYSGLFFVPILNASEAGDWDYDSSSPKGSINSSTGQAAKEVADMEKNMEERWNAHDLNGYLNYFWHSPQLVIVQDDGRISLGWNEFYESYKNGGFHSPDEMGEVHRQRLHVRMIHSDLAIMLLEFEVHFPTTRRTIDLVETAYVQKFDKEWKIIIGQTSISDMSIGHAPGSND